MARAPGSVARKLTSGGTKNVLYSGSTSVTRSEAGSANDIADGVTVLVTGSTNSDGGVTAERIQVLPEGQTGLPPAPSGMPAGASTATTAKPSS